MVTFGNADNIKKNLRDLRANLRILREIDLRRFVSGLLAEIRIGFSQMLHRILIINKL